jgi:hypothetical protein
MIDRFLELLVEATAKIPDHYFQLPVAGLEDQIFRERVYSYELYHQLRALQAGDRELTRYALSGEIDKQRHRIIRPCAPDVVLHIPGRMDKNLVVIEVKPINAGRAKIQKDRQNLEYFTSNEIGYRCGVQLVYGDEGALERFISIYRDTTDRVSLFWHPAPGRPAARVSTQP